MATACVSFHAVGTVVGSSPGGAPSRRSRAPWGRAKAFNIRHVVVRRVACSRQKRGAAQLTVAVSTIGSSVCTTARTAHGLELSAPLDPKLKPGFWLQSYEYDVETDTMRDVNAPPPMPPARVPPPPGRPPPRVPRAMPPNKRRMVFGMSPRSCSSLLVS